LDCRTSLEDAEIRTINGNELGEWSIEDGATKLIHWPPSQYSRCYHIARAVIHEFTAVAAKRIFAQ
jgi:hypothetical protein